MTTPAVQATEVNDTRRVVVWWSDAEYVQVEQAASRLGLSVTAYLHHLAIQDSTTTLPEKSHNERLSGLDNTNNNYTVQGVMLPEKDWKRLDYLGKQLGWGRNAVLHSLIQASQQIMDGRNSNGKH